MTSYTTAFANQINSVTCILDLNLNTARYYYYGVLNTTDHLTKILEVMPSSAFHFDSVPYLTLYGLIHQLTHLINELASLPKLIFIVFYQILNIIVTKNTN